MMRDLSYQAVRDFPVVSSFEDEQKLCVANVPTTVYIR